MKRRNTEEELKLKEAKMEIKREFEEKLEEDRSESYLKELLITKIRSIVDGPPYNMEGYEHAKAILKGVRV